MSDVTTIHVSNAGEYDVLIGRNFMLDESVLLSRLDGASQILIVHQPALETVATQIREVLGEKVNVLLAEVPDAEAAKRVEVAAFCWQVMGQANFTRSDAVIGLGGGAVTDLAGFVAATWLRGVRLVNIPTTLLGMVDASIGGKTGINTAEGKNLVGAFYAPTLVLCDLELLDTLPKGELLAGMAEVVKYGFIADAEILDILEADIQAATDPTSTALQSLIEKSVAIKARVVSEDFTESSVREVLNYGHTLGHAIEHAERYQWRHGAAISVGLVFAAELSRILANLPDDVVDRHRAILTSLGLPITYSAGRWESLLATMRRDKKARGSLLRFVVLDGVGKPRTAEVPDTSLLFAAYQEIAQ